MRRYNIRVNIGDNNTTHKFYFVHKNWKNLSDEEQDKAFDKAVKEINRVYEYGRFATQVGVSRLFAKYGFERTLP